MGGWMITIPALFYREQKKATETSGRVIRQCVTNARHTITSKGIYQNKCRNLITYPLSTQASKLWSRLLLRLHVLDNTGIDGVLHAAAHTVALLVIGVLVR